MIDNIVNLIEEMRGMYFRIDRSRKLKVCYRNGMKLIAFDENGLFGMKFNLSINERIDYHQAGSKANTIY